MTEAEHISVMPNEVMALLNVTENAVIVDGTLGLAGHSLLIAQQLGSQGHLIGIDRDAQALAQAKTRLAGFTIKKDFFHGNFKDIDQFLAQINIHQVDGVLLDLGISSFQLDNSERGFAFKNDGALDMRMDQGSGISAADIVNKYSEKEIEDIIYTYGEDRFAKRIARAIVVARTQKAIVTTQALADIVLRALPKGYTRGRIHPATRTFQALRIVVNDELESVKQGLKKAFDLLKPGGRLCVIAFHSLEDRIVKTMFRKLSDEGNAKLLVKKPLVPNEEEIIKNSRARSAKLRAVEKLA